MVETLEALTYPSTRFALSLVRSIASDYRASREIPKFVSAKARSLHLRGLANVKMMNQGEQNLLDDLREMDDSGSFAEFSSQSLYAYAVDWLGLTPAVALNLIAIMRRANQYFGGEENYSGHQCR